MEYVYLYLVDKNQLAGKLANYHGNGKSPFSVGNTSSEGLVFYCHVSLPEGIHVGECASPMDPSWVIKDSLTEIHPQPRQRTIVTIHHFQRRGFDWRLIGLGPYIF